MCGKLIWKSFIENRNRNPIQKTNTEAYTEFRDRHVLAYSKIIIHMQGFGFIDRVQIIGNMNEYINGNLIQNT